MAHLTCTTHKRRVHLSDSLPGVVMHRSDLSRCDFDVPVSIGGRVYTPWLLIVGRHNQYPPSLKQGWPPDEVEQGYSSRKDRPRKKTKK